MHILEPGVETFDTVLDVTEPMGMETLVYFGLEGTPVCGRVDPNAGAKDGAPMRLAMDLNNMHLLNEETGVVLVTPAQETQAGGERWRPTRRRFSLHKLCRKGHAPSSPSGTISSSSSFRT